MRVLRIIFFATVSLNVSISLVEVSQLFGKRKGRALQLRLLIPAYTVELVW